MFTAHVDVSTGPTLLFKTMPVLFGQLRFGYWVGLGFFVCLYFAALSASIALYEGMVAYLMDEHRLKRKTASVVTALIVLALGVLPAFSASLLSNVRIGERGLLQIIDQVVINWTIPIVTLVVVLFAARKLPESAKRGEFVDPKNLVSVQLYPTWASAIRGLVPGLIVFALILQVIIWLFLKA